MAIALGIHFALKQDDVRLIRVFTDSIASAKLAVDPSTHSGQMLSQGVCVALKHWLSGDPRRGIEFLAVPSSEKWEFHHAVHRHVTSFPQVAYGLRPFTSIACLRKEAVDDVLESWRQLYSTSSYKGRSNMDLASGVDPSIPGKPTYLSGGPWLPHVSGSNSLCARAVRAVTGHAPIGLYRVRFFPNESVGCSCGAALEGRYHIFVRCPNHKRELDRPPQTICELIDFLNANPGAFAFRPDDAGIG